MSVVTAVNNGHSKTELVMHLLCSMWFFVAHYDMLITVTHIPGAINSTVDYISRNSMKSFLS